MRTTLHPFGIVGSPKPSWPMRPAPMKPPPQKFGLQAAITAAGSQKALAKMIGKTQGHVSSWLLRKKTPAEMCIPIEEAVSGKVTRYDLRPDVFGPPPKTESPVTEQAA